MKEIHKVNLLYDFYGSLLTERQQKFIELYYGDDLSLGEIAEKFAVTRQAVHDTLKRAEQTLENYEQKLGLVGKFTEEYKSLGDVLNLLSHYQDGSDPNGLVLAKEKLEQILGSRLEFN
ncbi:UPF0122 protein [Desulfotomaculum nigrificans CO-1-SRB]|uniref:UPF0122 protein Desca_1099 n=1 Tax=Desulfotomaculum nigrificans (strain DSM 14880 / VKM B-2319 / CO-1-SRB) TaxID=868595 RepID=F6B365_DESCC|nr:YlxM family DNA-binding protein [Desulfotomaculum nigrificans]AEF93969.1 UPF0122 protein [Desulfotomaculum nigrificans CO-1-SRB]